MTEKRTEYIQMKAQPSLKEKAQELAKAEGRSLSNYIEMLLKREIENMEERTVFTVMEEHDTGDGFTIGECNTLEDANKVAERYWSRLSANDKRYSRVYVDPGTEDYVAGLFDSARADVKVEKKGTEFRITAAGIDIKISVDGICIEDLAEEWDAMDEDEVIEGLIEADIETVENSIDRRLFFNEKAAIERELEYHYKQMH